MGPSSGSATPCIPALGISLLGIVLAACGSSGEPLLTTSRAQNVRAQPPALDAGPTSDAGNADRAALRRREQVDALMQPLLDDEWLVGASIALIDHGHVETLGYGATREGGPAPDAHTIFEINSITKTFTTLLLADLVREGRLQLDDPVASLLPPTVRVPELNGHAITLLDLATHTSGLPRLPTNLFPEDPTPEEELDPYGHYEVSELYEFLSSYALGVEPGTVFEYSNLGMDLLGHALSLALGTSYDRAIARHISEPLGLVDTAVALSEEQQARAVDGHDGDLVFQPAWGSTPATEGAGALHSTAEDLAHYVVAQLAAGTGGEAGDAGLPTAAPDGGPSSLLAQSMALTHLPRRPIGGDETIGLGWIIQGPDLLYHDGSSTGQRGIVFFDQRLDVGAVILMNTYSPVRGPLATQLYVLLAGGTPTPLELPPYIRLPSDALDAFTGTFGSADSPIPVERDGTRLFMQVGAARRFGLYASGPTTFSARSLSVPVSASFEADDGIHYDRLILDLGGTIYPLPRLE